MSDITTPEERVDLDALDELHQDALDVLWEVEKRQPWRVLQTRSGNLFIGREISDTSGWEWRGGDGVYQCDDPYDDDCSEMRREADAEAALIVALRNAYPALAAELRALRAAQRVTREQIETFASELWRWEQGRRWGLGLSHKPWGEATHADREGFRKEARRILADLGLEVEEDKRDEH